MGKKKVVITTGIAAVGLLAVAGMLGKKQEGVVLGGNPKGKLVNVGVASTQDIQTRIGATGMVYAEKKEHVLAEINGKIASVNVDIGETVKKGDVLVTFDTETKESLERELESLDLRLESARLNLNQQQNASQSQIMQAEQAVLSAEQGQIRAKDELAKFDTNYTLANNSFETAKNQFEAVQELFTEGLASQQEVDQAEQAYLQAKDAIESLDTQKILLEKSVETANKQYESATYEQNILLNKVTDVSKEERIKMQHNEIASLELQRESIVEQLEKANLTVTAPMDGVVATVSAVEGMPVSMGAELVSIINPDELIVKSEISPYYATQLSTGLPVQIKYNGSTTVETTGVVNVVSPVAVPKQGASQTANTTAIPVEITLDDIKGLKEGLTVDVKIITEDVEDVVAVPLLATMQDDETDSYLYVVDEGVLEKRYVKQGAANNQLVEVSDVEVGEIVVTNPTEALEEGMEVSYLPIEEAGDVE